MGKNCSTCSYNNIIINIANNIIIIKIATMHCINVCHGNVQMKITYPLYVKQRGRAGNSNYKSGKIIIMQEVIHITFTYNMYT